MYSGKETVTPETLKNGEMNVVNCVVIYFRIVIRVPTGTKL